MSVAILRVYWTLALQLTVWKHTEVPKRKIIIKVKPFRPVFRTVLLYVVAVGWKGKPREVVPSSKKQRRRGMLLLEDDGRLMMEQ